MFKLDLEKAEEPEIKLPTSIKSFAKAREFQKNIYSCFIDYAKAFDCVDHNKLWKILKGMGIPDHLTSSWETCMQVKKQQLIPDMKQLTGSKLGNEKFKAVYYHPLYLTYAEYIMWKVRLDEAQAGIKIARTNINNLRYADDTTLMAESKEEWEPLDERERGQWKSWLKTQHSEN